MDKNTRVPKWIKEAVGKKAEKVNYKYTWGYSIPKSTEGGTVLSGIVPYSGEGFKITKEESPYVGQVTVRVLGIDKPSMKAAFDYLYEYGILYGSAAEEMQDIKRIGEF